MLMDRALCILVRRVLLTHIADMGLALMYSILYTNFDYAELYKVAEDLHHILRVLRPLEEGLSEAFAGPATKIILLGLWFSIWCRIEV